MGLLVAAKVAQPWLHIASTLQDDEIAAKQAALRQALGVRGNRALAKGCTSRTAVFWGCDMRIWGVGGGSSEK